MTNSHTHANTYHPMCFSLFFPFQILHAYFMSANKLFTMINIASPDNRPKQPFSLATCYFVYKVITNKVFK